MVGVAEGPYPSSSTPRGWVTIPNADGEPPLTLAKRLPNYDAARASLVDLAAKLA